MRHMRGAEFKSNLKLVLILRFFFNVLYWEWDPTSRLTI